MSKNVRTIYLAYGGAEATVFDSQVLLFLKQLRAGGIKSKLIAFQGLGTFFGRPAFLRAKRELAREMSGTDPLFLPRWPRDAGGVNTMALTKILNGYQDSQPILLHARGTQSAALALSLQKKIPYLKVIYDCRGLEAEEYLYIVQEEKKRHPTIWDKRWYEKLIDAERLACRQAHHIFCVSGALREHLIARHGASPERFDIVPGCVDLTRFFYDPQLRRLQRRKLNLDDKIVFAYAGSIRAWQGAEVLAEAFAVIQKAVPNAFLLALTTQPQQLTIALERSRINAQYYAIDTVEHKNLTSSLMLADVALMLREPNPVNRVASPTKGPEYLACGVPALTTPDPADFSRIVSQENVGAIAKSLKPQDIHAALKILLQEITKDPEAMRRRACAAGQKHYSWPTKLPIILERYRALMRL